MRIAVLVACVCYWFLLTVLLLVPNPAALVGLHAVPIFPWGKFGIHLIAFTGLGFLANATRWPNVPAGKCSFSSWCMASPRNRCNC